MGAEVVGVSERLKEIQERVNAATVGPWHIVGPPWNEGAPWINSRSEDPHGGEVVCDFTYMGEDADWRETNNSEANADFIAAARSDVPWLLARLTEVETARDALLDDVLVLMDHHTSEEVKTEARHRIIERHATPAGSAERTQAGPDA